MRQRDSRGGAKGMQGKAEAFLEEGTLSGDEHPSGKPGTEAGKSTRFPDHARVGRDHGG